MLDPQPLHTEASHVVLHSWVAVYLRTGRGAGAIGTSASETLAAQAHRLRESAILLQAALEKMRIANERLAARMAEHKSFFAKYQTPE